MVVEADLQWIIWHITNKCNLSCSYCYTDSHIGAHSGLKIDELYKIAEEINNTKAGLVTIIGGEPFTVKELPSIIEKLSEVKDRKINIDTNGTYLTTNWSDIYKQIYKINISIDDIRPDIHNAQRGAYAGVVDSIKFLKAHGVKYSANMVITNKNFDNIDKTASYLMGEGAYNIGFSRIVPMGRGKGAYAALALDKKQEQIVINKIVDFIIKHEGEALFQVHGFYDPRFFELGIQKQMPSCLCGELKAVINYDGYVYPCESFCFLSDKETIEKDFGKVYKVPEMHIPDILNTEFMKKWRTITRKIPNECSECIYKLYCSSGCPASNYYMTKELNRKDPLCSIE